MKRIAFYVFFIVGATFLTTAWCPLYAGKMERAWDSTFQSGLDRGRGSLFSVAVDGCENSLISGYVTSEYADHDPASVRFRRSPRPSRFLSSAQTNTTGLRPERIPIVLNYLFLVLSILFLVWFIRRAL